MEVPVKLCPKKSVLYESILAIPLKYGYCDIHRDVSGGVYRW